MTSLLRIYGHKIPVVFTSESQNLSVQLTLRPTSAIGVLFALVHQDTVPLSIALADYHPGTDEWRDVSSLIANCARGWFDFCHRRHRFLCVQYILVTADGAVIASTPAPLCDGRSHEIHVTISGNQTLLLVDGRSGRSEDAGVAADLLSQCSTFLGGLPGEDPALPNGI